MPVILHIETATDLCSVAVSQDTAIIFQTDNLPKEGDEPKLKGRFLYVRIRDCGMYARIELAGAAIDGNRLYMRGNAFVNPYGDRCLEAIEFTDIGYEDYKKCKRDAEKAMEQQRLAPRPPFEQLIKEGKAKY